MTGDGDDGSAGDATGERSARASGERTEEPSSGGGEGSPDDPSGETAETPGDPTDDSTPAADRDRPLSDLVDRVRRSRSGRDPGVDPDRAVGGVAGRDGGDDRESDPTGDADRFEAVDVTGLDAEAVWASLESDDGAVADGPAVGVGGEAERVERDVPRAGRPEHVVDKAAYCQRCEHFATPPDVECTHEGTEIVELVDAERFRVRGCPMADRDGPVEGRGDERND